MQLVKLIKLLENLPSCVNHFPLNESSKIKCLHFWSAAPPPVSGSECHSGRPLDRALGTSWGLAQTRSQGSLHSSDSPSHEGSLWKTQVQHRWLHWHRLFVKSKPPNGTRATSRLVFTGQLSQVVFPCFSETSRNVTSFEVGHTDKKLKVLVMAGLTSGLCGFWYLWTLLLRCYFWKWRRWRRKRSALPLLWLSAPPGPVCKVNPECIGEQLWEQKSGSGRTIRLCLSSCYPTASVQPS